MKNMAAMGKAGAPDNDNEKRTSGIPSAFYLCRSRESGGTRSNRFGGASETRKRGSRRNWSQADAIKQQNAAERMNHQSYYCQERAAELIAEIAEMQSHISNVFAMFLREQLYNVHIVWRARGTTAE